MIGWDYIVAENWNGRPIIRPNREAIGTLMEQVFGQGTTRRSNASRQI